MTTPREESTTCELDFGKVISIGSTKQRVVPVVLQNVDTGAVLFVGYANAEAVQATLDEGVAVLWSTSRQELWRKGATSGDILDLVDVRINCEQNSLLYRVRPRHGVCHTHDAQGRTRPSCFYRRVVNAVDLEFIDVDGESPDV